MMMADDLHAFDASTGHLDTGVVIVRLEAPGVVQRGTVCWYLVDSGHLHGRLVGGVPSCLLDDWLGLWWLVLLCGMQLVVLGLLTSLEDLLLLLLLLLPLMLLVRRRRRNL